MAGIGFQSLPRGIPAASLKAKGARGRIGPLRRLPRGIPAASLKVLRGLALGRSSGVSSAGNTRGLIEGCCGDPAIAARSRLPRGIPAASLKGYPRDSVRANWRSLPRGIPAASLKARSPHTHDRQGRKSSAGNTRGLIEGIAVSEWQTRHTARLPRGIPAASLKVVAVEPELIRQVQSSAGNTRGLIEGLMKPAAGYCFVWSLPRGIPAASLKEEQGVVAWLGLCFRLPRGIPAASLKATAAGGRLPPAPVFRGEYPRPH